MPPFSRSIHVEYVSPSSDDGKLYKGFVDNDWTYGIIAHGGYVLALVIEACIQYQASTSHRDPIHVTAHFLRATTTEPFTIRVHTLKTGKGFSNITAQLTQQDSIKVTVHAIFGVLVPSPTDPGPHLTLTPPSPYARRLPLHTHPSSITLPPVKFLPHAQWAEDPIILENNKPDNPQRINSSTIGGGGVEWGAWVELTGGKDEIITTPSLAFLVDVFLSLPVLLPRSERPGLTASRFPTMILTIEFKFPIPSSSSSDYASRTVGLYSSSRFMNDPQGRHDTQVEVWTAPCNTGTGVVVDGWRDKQVCLAVSTQMALTIPTESDLRKPKKGNSKL